MIVTLCYTTEYDIGVNYEVGELPEGWDGWSMNDKEEWVTDNGYLSSTDEDPTNTVLWNVVQ